MIAEFKAATERKTPLISMFWRPHWAIKAFDLKFVELPEAAPECFDDPAYGPNPDATDDCGFIKTRVFKAVWPAAYEILKNVKLTNDDQEPLVRSVDVDGLTVENVTQEWVKDHAQEMQSIVDAAKK